MRVVVQPLTGVRRLSGVDETQVEAFGVKYVSELRDVRGFEATAIAIVVRTARLQPCIAIRLEM